MFVIYWFDVIKTLTLITILGWLDWTRCRDRIIVINTCFVANHLCNFVCITNIDSKNYETLQLGHVIAGNIAS